MVIWQVAYARLPFQRSASLLTVHACRTYERMPYPDDKRMLYREAMEALWWVVGMGCQLGLKWAAAGHSG